MGRLRHSVPAAVLLSLASVCASCGGSSSNALPPPPVADFSLSLSSNSISIIQGAASPAQQFMTDVDGLHGTFLTTDENGQRLFAITSSDGTPQNAALTVVQLAAVPFGIGAITPAAVAVTGGATLTIHGSGFQNPSTVTINGKAASVTFKDVNTLLVVTPSLIPGSQLIAITNPDGETVSLDATFVAN